MIHGLLLTHVDDLLLLAETGLRKAVEKELNGRFPIDEWKENELVISDTTAALGKAAPFSLVDWRSKASSRVCRCGEGLEAGLYLRGLYLSMAYGGTFAEGKAAELADLHLLTDCKSLYDHLHREGVPKAPAWPTSGKRWCEKGGVNGRSLSGGH